MKESEMVVIVVRDGDCDDGDDGDDEMRVMMR